MSLSKIDSEIILIECKAISHDYSFDRLIWGGLIGSILIHSVILSMNPIRETPPVLKPVNLISAQLLKTLPQPTVETTVEPAKTHEVQTVSKTKAIQSIKSKEYYKKSHKILNQNQSNYQIDEKPSEKVSTQSEKPIESKVSQTTEDSKISTESKQESKSSSTKEIASKSSSDEKPKHQPEMKKASYLYHPKPEYPSASKQNNEQGKVILKVLVNPQGKPEDIQLKQSSGFDRLDQSAIQAVQRWTFKPATKDQEPIQSWVIVPIPFQLHHEDEE